MPTLSHFFRTSFALLCCNIGRTMYSISRRKNIADNLKYIFLQQYAYSQFLPLSVCRISSVTRFWIWTANIFVAITPEIVVNTEYLSDELYLLVKCNDMEL